MAEQDARDALSVTHREADAPLLNRGTPRWTRHAALDGSCSQMVCLYGTFLSSELAWSQGARW